MKGLSVSLEISHLTSTVRCILLVYQLNKVESTLNIIMDNFKEFFWDGEVIGLYLNRLDLKISEIANHCDKSQAEIYRILHDNGIKPNRLKTGHDAVRQLAERGWATTEIADMTGYTERNVRYILSKMRLSE